MSDEPLQLLRKAWKMWAAAAAVILILFAACLSTVWSPLRVGLWLLISSSLAGYQVWNLRRHLTENCTPDGKMLPQLGLANQMTILRGIFCACLAGFVAAPLPRGWLAWAPGLLYTASAILDYLDGYVARVTGQVTRLGETLDMDQDSLGVGAGSLLIVLYGQAPFWYLLVGLARYLFLLGVWMRRRSGLGVNPLPPNPYRRALAGIQMGVIAVLLLPVMKPPVTTIGAMLFVVPFLFNFWRDWLAVSQSVLGQGHLSETATKTVEWLLLGLRVLLASLLLSFLPLSPAWNQEVRGMAITSVVGITALGLLLGIAGRSLALVVLLATGGILQVYPGEARLWLALVIGAFVFYFGTGRYSGWTPEEWLIYHRAGER
jgi:CDP-diacylglycerol---glycerol-3-phosphate 3-phosphatidyltransferase